MTRLFEVQRRLRFVHSTRAALRWFAWGVVAATAGVILLWNWNSLPGPWQWLAAAGRPAELLWLPCLVALGGFASLWLVLPDPRKAAYRLDQLLDSQERILTAVDWILSEKPRTRASESILAQAADLLRDENRFRNALTSLETLPRRYYALPATLLAPLVLLYFLPDGVGLPRSTAIWLGESQVDRLTQDLLKELEDTDFRGDPQEKLEKLMQQLREHDPKANPGEEQEAARQQLQRAVDQLVQQAEAQKRARELLQTLAQRARQSQPISESDREALEALRRNLAGQNQREQLDEAAEAWDREDFEKAAEALESLQKEAGQTAGELSQAGRRAASEGGLQEGNGRQFDESQGDQFGEDGFARGEGSEEEGNGQGSGQGQGMSGHGEGEGEGQGQNGGDAEGEGVAGVGQGTTLEDQGDSQAAQGRQSLRRGDSESQWTEEYQHLHAPERTEYQKAQTRVQGEMGDEGPRFRTPKEGRGAVTQPSDRTGSGGLLEYREEAENAILREEVPADYRDNVRVYFESLER